MRVVRNFLLVLVAIIIIGSIGFSLWLRDRYVVPILTYHHVGVPSCKWRLNTVSEKSFDYQMNFIKRHGFQVISFDSLVRGIKEGHQFSRNTVVIQFDDGYEDNYKYAFPILKKYGFPAMIFLISDIINSPGFLTWDEMKEMEKYDILAGAHTRRHPYLPELDLMRAQDEIVGSKKVIEDHLGHSIDYFAYPTGGFTKEVKGLVQKAGYKAAVTTNRGKNKFNMDLYEIKRIHMNNTDDQYSGIVLWFKLSGYYNLFRHSRKCGVSQHKGFYE
ncbi:MAG: polysaccharide deacetylase family protein [Candidatus Omnitrophica bacterium]|nr:polysaccharide deacetylase family protein [Candidatus Omnitrophota bacterium]